MKGLRAVVAMATVAAGLGGISLGAAPAAYGQTAKATSYDCDQIRPCAKKSQGHQRTPQTSSQPKVSAGGSRTYDGSLGDTPGTVQAEAQMQQGMTNSVQRGGGAIYKPPSHK